jgi:1,4-alpha-glucan branching enzyme
MVIVESNGTATFALLMPDATTMHLVGTLGAWHEVREEMARDERGWWRVTMQIGSGEHLFRYLMDDRIWLHDEQAHGSALCGDGLIRSRLWIPPADDEPDSLAA